MNAKQVDEGLQVGAEATMAPTFKSRFGHPSSRWPMPGRERVVHGRMTQRALNAHRPKRSIWREEAGDANRPRSLSGAPRVTAGSSRFTLRRFSSAATSGGSAGVDFRPSASAMRGLRRPGYLRWRALDGLVQPQLAAPERLVAKRIEAENLPPAIRSSQSRHRDRVAVRSRQWTSRR